MKLDVVVYSRNSQLIVNDFHLRPLSSLIPYNCIDEDIMLQDEDGNYTRPHQTNIARFYDKTKSSFYQAKADPQLLSDWPIVLTKVEIAQREAADATLPIKTWDDTYWAGTQRMSYKLYNTTHEVLIPVWFEKIEDISKLSIEIGLVPIGGENAFIKKTLSFKRTENSRHHKFHNRFCDYLKDYFDYTGITEGNNKCININLRGNETQLYGLNVQDGNMQTRTDFNLSRNLLFRERPLLEANSLITNAFGDVHLILPQLINFNICFDTANWIPVNARDMFTQCMTIQAQVLYDGKPLEKYDLYTNHQYVPRPINEDIYSSHNWLPELTSNALDYKQDYNCVDLMHANKMVQPIVHWSLRDNTNILFNLYDGFGSSYKVPGESELYLGSHFFGNVNDPYSTKSDPVIPNTSPFGPKRIGDGDEVEYVLNNIEHFTFDDPYFIEMSKGWVNGFRMKYSPDKDDEIQEILLAGMTTNPDYTRELKKTPDSQTVTNTEYFAVWTARYDANGKDTLPDLRFARTIDDDYRDRNSHDYKYDVALYHDMDNRWYDYIKAYQNHIWQDYELNSELQNKVPDVPYDENNLQKIKSNMDICQRYVSLYKEVVSARQQVEKAQEYIDYYLCDAYEYAAAETHGDGRTPAGYGGLYTKHRLEVNSYGMYFCIKKVDWPTAGPGKKAIAMLIWDQSNDANDASKGLIYKKKLSFQNIGFIMECIRMYVKWVKKYIDVRWFERVANDPNNPNYKEYKQLFDAFSALDLINTVSINSEMPGVWSFYNTIRSYQDSSVSKKAAETVFKKDTTYDTYVYRFDGQLKPAMYPLAVRRNPDNESGFEYSKLFGINYLWFKKIYGDGVDWSVKQQKKLAADLATWKNRDKTDEYSEFKLFSMYSKSGVPPKYPSLRYDSIYTDDAYGPNLLYDEPIPQVKEYKEYKWFDQSCIIQYPTTLTITKEVEDIDPASDKLRLRLAIRDIMIDALREVIDGEFYDKNYIDSIYDVSYELISSRRSNDGSNKLLYTYKITMKLK